MTLSGHYGTALRAIGVVSNLVDVVDGSAELGYRIAERATGLGLATAAVRQVCELAANDYGPTSLRAPRRRTTSPRRRC